MSRTRCPECQYRFGWAERWHFSRWTAARRIVHCPRCKTPLTWWRWPWWGINISSILLIAAVLSIWIYDFDSNYYWPITGLFWAGTITLMLSALLLRIVPATSKKDNHEDCRTTALSFCGTRV
jgi:membrane protein YdbS with pleckstrin-like domain